MSGQEKTPEEAARSAPLATVTGWRGHWVVKVGAYTAVSVGKKGEAEAVASALNRDGNHMLRWAVAVSRAPLIQLPKRALLIYTEFAELGAEAVKAGQAGQA